MTALDGFGTRPFFYYEDGFQNTVPITAKVGTPEWRDIMVKHDALLGDTSKRRVELCENESDGTFISTVFLGYDVGFYGPEPICYQTLVQVPILGIEQDIYLWQSRQAAKEGHAIILRNLLPKIALRYRRIHRAQRRKPLIVKWSRHKARQQ